MTITKDGHSTSSGQPLPAFNHLHSKRRFFLHLDKISCISICAHYFLVCLWRLLRAAWLVLIRHTHAHTEKITFTVLSLSLLRCLLISLVSESPNLDPVLQVCPTRPGQSRRIISSHPLETLCGSEAQEAVGHLCWLMFIMHFFL